MAFAAAPAGGGARREHALVEGQEPAVILQESQFAKPATLHSGRGCPRGSSLACSYHSDELADQEQ